MEEVPVGVLVLVVVVIEGKRYFFWVVTELDHDDGVFLHLAGGWGPHWSCELSAVSKSPECCGCSRVQMTWAQIASVTTNVPGLLQLNFSPS